MLKLLQLSRFMQISEYILPWMLPLVIVTYIAGISLAFKAPSDYQQGEMVRIMYIHVPAAWMSLMIYSVMAVASAGYIIWKNPLLDLIARGSAPIGACFAFITLVTGSLWGKPIWGTWWVWDARLTSMFILFLFYLGYIALAGSAPKSQGRNMALAVLAIIGFINVPIVKFSVTFWNSLHQPASIIRLGKPTIHSTMLTPLLIMFIGNVQYFIMVLILRVKNAINAHRAQAKANLN